MTVERGRPRALLLSSCAALLLAPSAATGREAPVRPDAFGINNGVLWPDGLGELPTARHADAIGRTGLASVRAIPYWDQIEPQAPNPRTGEHTYDWTRPDAIARHLARNGLRWDALLGFSTPWGGEVPGTTGGAPRIGPFVSYATAVARRYGRDGEFWRRNPDLPYVPMTQFQVWNEPNLSGSVLAIRPTHYADLYLAVRRALLEVDPHARVAIGGLVHSARSGTGNAAGFLQDMFAARPALAGNVDAVGVTIYRQNPEQVLEQVRGLREILDRLGERSTPIDIHETGWATRGTVLLTDIAAVSEERRTAMLPELVDLLAASDCGVQKVTPFAWVTQESLSADAAGWFGLADRRTAELKPSGRAYVDAVRRVTTTPVAPAVRCNRPDLPRLVTPDAARRAPLAPVASRRCSRGRFVLRFGLGTTSEPYSRLEVTLPGGRPRVTGDPDGGGPATLPARLTLPIPRRRGTITVVAKDALGREQDRATLRLARCPAPGATRR